MELPELSPKEQPDSETRKCAKAFRESELTVQDIDKVRHIKGFPIAKDEDIIMLSEPHTTPPVQNKSNVGGERKL